jgi:ribosome maturation factor RimP
MEMTLVERLEAIVGPEAERNGYELVAIEMAGGHKQPVVRVFLDREEGIDIDAIVSANRWIGELFDTQDPIGGPYTLEVSSPGIDRPLRKAEDFERFVGDTATVKTLTEQGKATYTGRILGTDGTSLELEVEGQNVRIALESVTKARLKGVVDFNTEGSGEPR